MNGFFKDVRTIERMKRGPLGRYITLYGDELLAHGYRRKSCRRKLQLAADFTRWLDRKKIVAKQAIVRHVEDYLQSRKRFGVGIHLGDRAAVIDFLKLLREQRVTKERISLRPVTPSQKLLREYDLYLQTERAVHGEFVIEGPRNGDPAPLPPGPMPRKLLTHEKRNCIAGASAGQTCHSPGKRRNPSRSR